MFQRAVASVMSALIIIQFSGCYSLKGVSKAEINYADKAEYYIHGTTSAYRISNTIMSDGVLSGTLSQATEQVRKKNIIHIYAAPDSAIRFEGNTVRIPFENIAKIETNKVDGVRTLILAGGVAYISLTIVALILILTKNYSCPFVYSENGTEINLEGEIYSGASATPIERDDYLWLKTIMPVDDHYRIRITNEVKEIQNTNLAELMVIDHPAKTGVIVDKYGVPHSVEDIRKPLAATNTYGTSILGELSALDTSRYISDIRNDDILMDTVALSFDRPLGSTRAKLVISGKNTMWLDYTFARFSDMFGNKYEKWKESRNKKPREETRKWMLDQGIPLSVYLETDAGYKFVDYYNVAGPAADRKDVLDIDLSGISGDRVNVKLVSGMLFWEIDFAGMDFSADREVTSTILTADYAFDENGKDVSSLLKYDDEMYLVQPLVNNEACLRFRVPPVTTGTERSVFLHSKGNYEPLRETKGKPDIKYLKTMLDPGMYTKFTKDHFLRYYARFYSSASADR